MKLPITFDNVRDWFPSPHTENPLAADPWWAVQGLGLFVAIQYLRLIPDGPEQQQALIELRRSLDTGLLVLPPPPDEEIARRLAQTLAPYAATPEPVVEAMLTLADVGPGDRLIDLGSGDGRIVFAAAARGARALGVDIDARFVAEAQARVGDRTAQFVQEDIHDADLDGATVITCYLLRSSMAALCEKFRQLRPGTRIISHAFGMPAWEPTRTISVEGTQIHLWIV